MLSFEIWLALNLRFSWAFLTSSPNCWFSDSRFLTRPLIDTFSWSICYRRPLYSWSSWKAFDCWAFDSLMFYWAFLTSYPSPAFSWWSFWIFFLRASLSESLDDSFSRYWLSSLLSLEMVFALNLRFYWAFCTSSFKCWFSWTRPFIFLLIVSFSP